MSSRRPSWRWRHQHAGGTRHSASPNKPTPLLERTSPKSRRKARSLTLQRSVFGTVQDQQRLLLGSGVRQWGWKQWIHFNRTWIDAKKIPRASTRKHCASGLRAPQAFEKALCATRRFMLGEVTAPLCYCQAKIFHQPSASSVDLFQSFFFVFSLHLLCCVPTGASPDRERGVASPLAPPLVGKGVLQDPG